MQRSKGEMQNAEMQDASASLMLLLRTVAAYVYMRCCVPSVATGVWSYTMVALCYVLYIKHKHYGGFEAPAQNRANSTCLDPPPVCFVIVVCQKKLDCRSFSLLAYVFTKLF
jgi:hypothetical protein